MNKTKHTPGPWHINGYAFKRDSSAPTGRRVFLCGSNSDLAEGYTINAANCEVCNVAKHRRLADARLIAAAPDLLVALELAADDIIFVLEEIDGEPDIIAGLESRLAAIRRAIAKAKGE